MESVPGVPFLGAVPWPPLVEGIYINVRVCVFAPVNPASPPLTVLPRLQPSRLRLQPRRPSPPPRTRPCPTRTPRPSSSWSRAARWGTSCQRARSAGGDPDNIRAPSALVIQLRLIIQAPNPVCSGSHVPGVHTHVWFLSVKRMAYVWKENMFCPALSFLCLDSFPFWEHKSRRISDKAVEGSETVMKHWISRGPCSLWMAAFVFSLHSSWQGWLPALHWWHLRIYSSCLASSLLRSGAFCGCLTDLPRPVADATLEAKVLQRVPSTSAAFSERPELTVPGEPRVVPKAHLIAWPSPTCWHHAWLKFPAVLRFAVGAGCRGILDLRGLWAFSLLSQISFVKPFTCEGCCCFYFKNGFTPVGRPPRALHVLNPSSLRLAPPCGASLLWWKRLSNAGGPCPRGCARKEGFFSESQAPAAEGVGFQLGPGFSRQQG